MNANHRANCRSEFMTLSPESMREAATEELAEKLYEGSVVRIRTGLSWSFLSDSIKSEWIGIAAVAKEALHTAELRGIEIGLERAAEVIKYESCKGYGGGDAIRLVEAILKLKAPK